MADEKTTTELAALVADVGEHLRYFGEIGGKSLELKDMRAAPLPRPSSSSSSITSSATNSDEAPRRSLDTPKIGVGGVAATPAAAAAAIPPRETPSQGAPAALARNARAPVPKLPPITRKSYAPPMTPAAATTTPPPAAEEPTNPGASSLDDRPPTPAAVTAIDQTEMPKRTNQTGAAADAATPPPQETLFGVITPKDEESLPRANETLADIRADVGDCTRCPLHAGRTHIVHTEGNDQARLMFVGEAPGADEDAQARPFIGRAGQLLNKIIEAIGMRREDVFIGNVNRCRPPQNRTPTPAEAATCKPFLLREIAIVRPAVIVVLGNTAMKNLLDTKEGITKLRGQFQDYRGIKVMPTFHPAYLLRDPSKKRETWEDMKKVREYLDQLKSA